MAFRRGGTFELAKPIVLSDDLETDIDTEDPDEVLIPPGHCNDPDPNATMVDRCRRRMELLRGLDIVGPHPFTRLDVLAVHMLSQMNAVDLFMLTKCFKRMVQKTDGEILLGSMCSGTDLVAPLFKQLFARIEQHVQQPASQAAVVRHLFSVEKSSVKRAWVQKNRPPEILFADMEEMRGFYGKNQLTDTVVRIPQCHILFAGISCKTLSGLNNSTRRGCFSCTGKTCSALEKYLQHFRPPMVIMESVASILEGRQGFQNKLGLKAMATRLGYDLLFGAFSSLDYGFPQDRSRAWILLMYVGMDKSQWSNIRSRASDLMRKFKVPETISYTIEDILLSPLHPDFKHWAKKHIEQMSTRQYRVKPVAKRKAGFLSMVKKKILAEKARYRWQVEHEFIFKEKGFYWPPLVDISRPNEFTKLLDARSHDCLLLDELCVKRSTFTTRVVMLGHSLKRNVGNSRYFPCIVPKAHFWERARLSPVWGWELLMTQGLEEGMAPAYKEFSNHTMVDLAGHTLAPFMLCSAFQMTLLVSVASQVARSKRKETTPVVCSSMPLPRQGPLWVRNAGLDFDGSVRLRLVRGLAGTARHRHR